MDKLFGLPVVIDSALDMDEIFIGHKAHERVFNDALIKGSGLLHLDLSALERSFSRGSAKSLMWGMRYFDDYMQHTVKHELNMLQTAQTTNGPGTDPLFEAMEKHNQLMKMGRACMKEMFHAKPLNLNQHTNGPVKAKDWE